VVCVTITSSEYIAVIAISKKSTRALKATDFEQLLCLPISAFKLKLKINTSYSNMYIEPSQVNTLPKAKSKTRSKQNKDVHKCSSVYSEREVPLPVLTSGGE
jgi:hypothetical protein